MRATIESGSSISHYRVMSPLGSGGMGEVYVAKDMSLERTVALKILPPQLTASEERVRRFVQEAKSASSLSHPHIVTIHEIGHADVKSDDGEGPKSDPVHFIAMELIDGVTMKAKIHSEKTDLRTLLGYLRQAAEGLAKAHAAGIVHRDLKPENIMVSKDGYAKILDFGLAKLQIKGGGEKPADGATEVRDETRDGVVLGTVGYMSPEQVQGRRADHRSDIFSFGCILYEAATRQRPFRADSDVEVMHKILNEKPEPIDTLNPEAPAELRRLIRRCLAKDPEKRYQSMKDLALELGELADEYDELSHSSDSRPSIQSGSTSGAAVAVSSPNRRMLAIVIASAVVVAVVGVFLVRRLTTAKAVAAPAFASMKITRLTTSGNVATAAISPDNRYLADVVVENGKSSLYVRQIATGAEAQLVAPTPLGFRGVTFSPDGNYLYYVQGESEQSAYSVAYQVPSLGGTPRKILFDVDTPLTFAPDGKQFAFVRGYPQRKESVVMICSVDGGAERRLATRKSPLTFPLSAAAWSPDGKKIAAVGVNRTQRELVIVDVADGREQVITAGRWADITGIAWLPDSTGIITTGTTVEAGQEGQVFLVSYPAGEIRKITNDLNNYLEATVTSDGKTIATIQSAGFSNLWSVVPGQESSDKELTHGAQQQLVGLSQVADGRLIYGSRSNGKLTVWEQKPTGERRQLSPNDEIVFNPTASSDGKVILVSRVRDGKLHVARLDPDGSTLRDVTNGAGESRPRVSPDGSWFLYTADDGTIMRMPTAGGTPVRIADLSAGRPDISSDGTKVLTSPILQIGERAARVFVVVPANGGSPLAKLERDGITFNAFSPAADAIDYVIRKDGVDNIWRQPITGGEPKQLTKFTERFIISFVWKPDGKTLLVNRGDTTDDVVLISEFR